MPFPDSLGSMDLSADMRVESPTEGKKSKSDFLDGWLGQANFMTTDALWKDDKSGSADSADTYEFPGSPKSLGTGSLTSIGRSRSPFSSAFSASGESDVDRLIADLKDQNDTLRNELDSMQQREVDLGFKLELAEDRLRKEIVMFEESASLKSDERDETSHSSGRSARQKQEIRESASNFSLQYSFSHADDLQYTKDKLAEAEEKLRRMSEEKAAMSAEAKPDPSNKQLEELTKKVEDGEKKLLEREEDLVQLYRFTEDMEMKQEELEGSVIIHKKEADELRKQLAETKKELEENVARRVAAESEVAQWEKESSLKSSSLTPRDEDKRMKILRDENTGLKKALADFTRKSGTEAAKVANALQASKSEIAQLKSQLSDAATQYKQFEERFNEMKQESTRKISGLQRENMRLRESLTTIEQQGQIEHSLSQEEYYLGLKNKVDELEKEKLALESDLEQRSSELNGCQTFLSEKSVQLDEAQSRLDDLTKCQAVLRKSEERISALEQENDTLRKTLAENKTKSEEELKASVESLAGLQIQVNEMKSSVKALNSEVEERSNQLLESQALLSEKTKQHQEAEATFAEEVEELSTLRRENEELRDSLGKSQHHAKIDLLESKERIEELQSEIEVMGRTMQALRLDAEESSARFLEYQTNIDETSLQIMKAQEDMRSLQDKNKELKESHVKAEEKSRLELEASQKQVVGLQNEVTEMKATVEELQSNIEVRSAELKQSEAFSAEKAAQLQDALARLDESRASLVDTSKQLKDAEAALDSLKSEKVQLEQTLDEVEKKRFSDIKSSQARVAGLKTQVEEMSKTIDSLKAEVEEKSSDLQESEALGIERTEQLKEMQAKFDQSQGLLSDKTAQLEKAEEDFATLKKETVQLNTSLVELEKRSASALQESEERVSRLQLQVDEMTSTIESLQSEVEARSSRFIETESLLAGKSKNLEEIQNRLARSQETLEDKSKQLEEANAISKLLQSENDQLKESLSKVEAKNAVEQKGSQERVADLQSQAQEMTRMIESLQATVEARTSEVDALKISLSGKSKKLEEAAETLASMCNENLKLKDICSKSEQQSQRALQEADEQLSGLNQQVEEMASMVQSLKSDLEEKSSKLLSAQTSLDEKSKMLQDAEERYAALYHESLKHDSAFAEVEKQSRLYMATARERVSSLQKEADEMTKALQSLQKECDNRVCQLDESQASLAEKTRQLKEAETAMAKLEQEILQLRQLLEAAQKQAQEHAVALQAECEKSTATLESLRSANEQQAMELVDSRAMLSEKVTQLREAESRFDHLQQQNVELESLRSTNEQQATELVKSRAMLSEKKERIEELQSEIEVMGRTMQALRLDAEESSARLLEYQSNTDETSLQIMKAQEDMRLLQNKNKELKESHVKAEETSRLELEASQKQVVGLQNEVTEMKATVEELQSNIEVRSAELKESEAFSVELESLRSTNEYQATELVESRATLSEKVMQLREFESRFNHLQQKSDELESLRSTNEHQATELVESRAMLSEKVMQLQEIESRFDHLQQKSVELESLRSTNEQQATELVDNQAMLSEKLVQMNVEIESLRSTNEHQATELVESRAMLSEKVMQLQEIESRFDHLQQKNMELTNCLITAEVQSQRCIPTVQESALIRSTGEDKIAGIMPSLQLSFVNQSSHVYEHREVEFGTFEALPDIKERQLVTIQADVGDDSPRDLVEARDDEASTRIQTQADEMTRTIHALRSQIEERTCRLMERKKMAKHSKQLQQVGTKQTNLLVDVDEWKRRTHDAHSLSAIRGELLSSLQKDMEITLASSKETIQRLEQDVAQWKNVAAETEKALHTCKEEFLKTKQELQMVVSSLDEVLVHKEMLSLQVTNFEKSTKQLEERLRDEKQQKKEVLAAAERKMESMRREYESVINEMQELASQEVSESDLEVRFLVDMHDRLLQSNTIESGHFNEKLASYKQITDSVSKTKSLQETTKTASEDDDEIEVLRSRTASSDMESCGLSLQMIEMSEINGRLLDAMESMKDEVSQLQEENYNLQSQLGAKYDLFCKVQSQFESLQKEYNAVLSENRALRKDNSSIASLQKCVVSAITGSTEALSVSRSYGPPVRSKKERDLMIESLTSEKRELLARSSTAVADLQRMEKEAWNARQEIAKLRNELRSANLAKSALQLCLESKEQGHRDGGGSIARDQSPPSGDKATTSQSDKVHVRDLTCVEGGKGPSSSEMVALEGMPSSGDTSQESVQEVECMLTKNELGAELLINEGSQSPSISPMHTMVEHSSSEDESIEEVECTLDATEATVTVSDGPLPSSAMVVVGFIPLVTTTEQEPSLVEGRVKDNAPDYTMASAAMVAKILSQHEMRYRHEMSSPRSQPLLNPPSNGSDVESAISLVRKIRKNNQEKKKKGQPKGTNT